VSRKIYFREIYMYIVCIIAIIIFIIGIVSVYNGSVNFVWPTTYNTRQNIISMYSEQYKNLSSAEMEEMAEEELAAAASMEKNMAFKELLRGIVLIIISIPLFIFHWTKAQAMWRIDLAEKDND